MALYLTGLHYWVCSMKKGLRKRFSKGALTSSILILSITLPNEVTVRYADVKNVVPQWMLYTPFIGCMSGKISSQLIGC
jgi:hypothetical protein